MITDPPYGVNYSGLAQARRRTRFHSRSSAGQNQQNPHRRLTVSRPTRRIRGPRLMAVNLCRLFGRTEPRAAEQDRPSEDWLAHLAIQVLLALSRRLRSAPA